MKIETWGESNGRIINYNDISISSPFSDLPLQGFVIEATVGDIPTVTARYFVHASQQVNVERRLNGLIGRSVCDYIWETNGLLNSQYIVLEIKYPIQEVKEKSKVIGKVLIT